MFCFKQTWSWISTRVYRTCSPPYQYDRSICDLSNNTLWSTSCTKRRQCCVTGETTESECTKRRNNVQSSNTTLLIHTFWRRARKHLKHFAGNCLWFYNNIQLFWYPNTSPKNLEYLTISTIWKHSLTHVNCNKLYFYRSLYSQLLFICLINFKEINLASDFSPKYNALRLIF